MKITSPAFKQGEMIPERYTCDGDGVRPTLDLEDVPATASSLAIIIDDPDAPGGSFVHWIVWNIPPKIGAIKEGEVPSGAIQGMSGANSAGWVAPCPPSGMHRYVFTLYALNASIDLREGATKEELLFAMQNRIIEISELVGAYRRRHAV